MQELLREGAVVVAPLATEEQVERLLADCDAVPTHKLFPVVTDVASEAAAAAFFQDVQQEHGGIDHAVSVFGTFWQGGAAARPTVAAGGCCWLLLAVDALLLRPLAASLPANPTAAPTRLPGFPPPPPCRQAH